MKTLKLALSSLFSTSFRLVSTIYIYIERSEPALGAVRVAIMTPAPIAPLCRFSFLFFSIGTMLMCGGIVPHCG